MLKRLLHVVGFLAFSFVAFAHCALAQSTDSPQQNLASTRNTVSIAALQQSAAKGNSWAHLQLADLYMQGEKLPLDPKQAIAHYQVASKEIAEASFKLGNIYSQGKGTRKNVEKAFKYYIKAAHQNHVPSQLRLGLILEHGLLGKQNQYKSFYWYKKAAILGNAKAQYKVGLALHQGKGVKKNNAQAQAWFELASHQGSKISEKLRAKLQDRLTDNAISHGRHIVTLEMQHAI